LIWIVPTDTLVESVIGFAPVALNVAVPVGTVFGDQLVLVLQLPVAPFHVAFCACADAVTIETTASAAMDRASAPAEFRHASEDRAPCRHAVANRPVIVAGPTDTTY
jgi:hypothetical protein